MNPTPWSLSTKLNVFIHSDHPRKRSNASAKCCGRGTLLKLYKPRLCPTSLWCREGFRTVFFFFFSEVMSLCIEAHNNFRATATSGCDICNFEPNYLSALVLGACPSVISSLCAFCYRRRFIGILFRLRSMRVYKCRRPLRPR